MKLKKLYTTKKFNIIQRVQLFHDSLSFILDKIINRFQKHTVAGTVFFFF